VEEPAAGGGLTLGEMLELNGVSKPEAGEFYIRCV
jgi:hypothetical protein